MRTGLFLLDAAAHLRFEHRTAELRQQAHTLSWMAQNLTALNGVDVVVDGDVPDRPALLVSDADSPLDALALMTTVPAVVVRDGLLDTAADAVEAGVFALVPHTDPPHTDAAEQLCRNLLSVASQRRIPLVPVTVRCDLPADELPRDGGWRALLSAVTRSRTTIRVGFGTQLSPGMFPHRRVEQLAA